MESSRTPSKDRSLTLVEQTERALLYSRDPVIWECSSFAGALKSWGPWGTNAVLNISGRRSEHAGLKAQLIFCTSSCYCIILERRVCVRAHLSVTSSLGVVPIRSIPLNLECLRQRCWSKVHSSGRATGVPSSVKRA